MSHLTIILIVVLLGPAFASAEAPSGRRLTELFLWKLSDELGLSADLEKELQQAVFALEDERAQAQLAVERALKEAETATPKARGKALAAYGTALAKAQGLGADELKRIRRLLGDERAVRYFVLKRDFALKLKELLSERGKGARELPPPKIIEK